MVGGRGRAARLEVGLDHLNGHDLKLPQNSIRDRANRLRRSGVHRNRIGRWTASNVEHPADEI
ncbi:MAG: hypothetical protein DCF29_02420 [Alphaproteobacteria bacterium]|nr:MAG: hypothetical protein DCF29_02420 [Alphaproteobacteria bacterium]